MKKSCKKNYVVVFPDGTEYFKEDLISSHHDCKKLCEEAVYRSTLKTSRAAPTPIKVKLFSIEIIKGKLDRMFIGEYEIMPNTEPMTDFEYLEEMKNILSVVPEEFRYYVENEAYDKGHSSGYDEVIMLARSIVWDMTPCIEKYRLRLLNKKED